MRRMRVAALLVTVLALTVATAANAAEPSSVRGTLVALVDAGVAVKDAKGVVTKCARTDRSPSLDGYAVGDRVQVVCVPAKKRLVLVKARKLETAPPKADTEPVTFGGVVARVADGSLTVRDGDHELTCAVKDDSPATGDLKVGQRVKVQCVSGVLTRLAVAPAAPTIRTAAGNITTLSERAISIHNDENGGFDVTCTLGPSSPALGDYKVGDRVGLACADGVLVKIAKIR